MIQNDGPQRRSGIGPHDDQHEYDIYGRCLPRESVNISIADGTVDRLALTGICVGMDTSVASPNHKPFWTCGARSGPHVNAWNYAGCPPCSQMLILRVCAR
jgi:hypothetical protein